MKMMLLVALGGGIGSVARYKLGAWVLHNTPEWHFPAGTFLVNVLGCLVAGVLAGVSERYEVFSAEARVFLFTGLLGGFTTFSAFGVETTLLLRRGEFLVGGAYVVASVACGILALWLAFRLIGR